MTSAIALKLCIAGFALLPFAIFVTLRQMNGWLKAIAELLQGREENGGAE